MIDLNHILLFIAIISPLVMLGQTLRRGGLFRAWRIAAFAVLFVSAGAWLIDRDSAGFVGGGAWLALLLVPAIGLKKIAELASHERYRAARRWALALRLVHPAAELPAQAQLFEALDTAQGDFQGALARLAPLRNNDTTVGRQAIAESFRITGEWTNIVGWVRSEVPAPVRRSDLALLAIYLRALGEVGARDEMVLEFATMLSNEGRPGQPLAAYHACRLVVLAFSGRLEAQLDSSAFRKLPTVLREFWTATNEFAIGDPQAARTRLEKLQDATSDRLLASEIQLRLARGDAIARAALLPPTFALLHRIEEIDRQPTSLFGSSALRPTAAVLVFMALNVAMFIAEIRLGGSMNPYTLERLGALEPWKVRFNGEYWRLLTSLFLHFGPLHLLFNLYALLVIGPGLERLIGPWRFATYYLLAGLGSSACVLLLGLRQLTRFDQLVGASGCVLGIVGVWAGYLLRHRKEPFAGRRLRNILLIIAIQAAFDLSTPQISMAAHLSGLVVGIALGLLIGPRRSRPAAGRWNA